MWHFLSSSTRIVAKAQNKQFSEHAPAVKEEEKDVYKRVMQAHKMKEISPFISLIHSHNVMRTYTRPDVDLF